MALVLFAYVCLELTKDAFATSHLPQNKMTIGDVKLALSKHFGAEETAIWGIYAVLRRRFDLSAVLMARIP